MEDEEPLIPPANMGESLITNYPNAPGPASSGLMKASRQTKGSKVSSERSILLPSNQRIPSVWPKLSRRPFMTIALLVSLIIIPLTWVPFGLFMFRDLFMFSDCAPNTIQDVLKKYPHFVKGAKSDPKVKPTETEISETSKIAVDACRASVTFEVVAILTGSLAALSSIFIYLHSCKASTPSICPCGGDTEPPYSVNEALLV
jgi:hypothetical protein